jgi:hypothetical protein
LDEVSEVRTFCKDYKNEEFTEYFASKVERNLDKFLDFNSSRDPFTLRVLGLLFDEKTVSGLRKARSDVLIGKAIRGKHDFRKERGMSAMVVVVDMRMFLQSSYESMMGGGKVSNLKYNEICVNFRRGGKAGGRSMEKSLWLKAIEKEMVDPKNKLFDKLEIEGNVCAVSRNSIYLEDCLEYFRFVGRVMALIIMNKEHLIVPLSPIIYKFILDQRCSMEDLIALYPKLYANLLKLKEDPQSLTSSNLYFFYNKTVNKKTRRIYLRKDGDEIRVTEDNNDEFIREMMYSKVIGGRERQMEELRKGFREIVDLDVLKFLNEEDLKDTDQKPQQLG